MEYKYIREKKLFDIDEYINDKVESGIANLKFNIEYEEKEINFLSSHTAKWLRENKGSYDFSYSFYPLKTDEEQEYDKQRSLSGRQSGLSRRKTQLKKVEQYKSLIIKNKKVFSKVYLTQETIKDIFEKVLKVKCVNKAFLNRYLLPEYINVDSKELNVNHYRESISYIYEKLEITFGEPTD